LEQGGLLRTNLTESDPVKLWEYYLQLVAVEEAFKTLKGDLSIRLPARDARTSAEAFGPGTELPLEKLRIALPPNESRG
jgi:hypothetical protein